MNGEELPITAVRNLAMSPDEAVRKAAYEAELGAWKANEIAIAAALNGYKGEISTLNRRRGWADDLAPVLFDNRIKRKTLEAMQKAIGGKFSPLAALFQGKSQGAGKGETRLVGFVCTPGPQGSSS